nr:MAG TPA: hypothetical protein [Caudoviricetes sp.]
MCVEGRFTPYLILFYLKFFVKQRFKQRILT